MSQIRSNLALLLLVALGLGLIVAVVCQGLAARTSERTPTPRPTPGSAAQVVSGSTAVATAQPARPEPPDRPEVRYERISLSTIQRHDLSVREALFYRRLKELKVQCALCPNFCVLRDGERGRCKVRVNVGGTLRTLVYGRIVSAAVDPIEKKPLFHVLPASRAMSIATAGCNLGCVFCQNWQISQMYPENVPHRKVTPEWVVESAVQSRCDTIAYTYNEPSVFYEFMVDTATLAHAKGIRNVWITCGYINPEPLRKLCKVIDAANVDLKGFTDVFYKRYLAAKLAPVLSTLKVLKEEGVWFEITNLIIPDVNDEPGQIREMCKWIVANVGPDVPVHFSRFHPDYKLRNKPSTPLATLDMAARVAREVGVRYVYVGNVRRSDSGNTYCPQCRRLLIERRAYWVVQNNIREGKCPGCGAKIAGIWTK